MPSETKGLTLLSSTLRKKNKKKKKGGGSTPTKHTCTKTFHFHACRANKIAGGRQHLAMYHNLPQGTDLVLCCLSLEKWWLQAADGEAKQYSYSRENSNGSTLCLCLILANKCTNLYRAMFIVHSYTKLS